MENPVSKQCRPWSDVILSGSALFAYDLFMGCQVPGKNDLSALDAHFCI